MHELPNMKYHSIVSYKTSRSSITIIRKSNFSWVVCELTWQNPPDLFFIWMNTKTLEGCIYFIARSTKQKTKEMRSLVSINIELWSSESRTHLLIYSFSTYCHPTDRSKAKYESGKAIIYKGKFLTSWSLMNVDLIVLSWHR